MMELPQIVPAFSPVNLATAANAGDWISLKNYKSVWIMFHSAVGTAGEDPTVTLLQASAVAGTGSKALNINTTRIFKKQAATNLTTTGQWSSAAAGVTANAWTDGAAAEEDVILAIGVDADELDVDNGFDCVSISVADVGTSAQLGAAYYILGEPRYQTQANSLPSAIAD
jgi:hypothetical protein